MSKERQIYPPTKEDIASKAVLYFEASRDSELARKLAIEQGIANGLTDQELMEHYKRTAETIIILYSSKK